MGELSSTAISYSQSALEEPVHTVVSEVDEEDVWEVFRKLSHPPAPGGVKCLGTLPKSSMQPPSSYITFMSIPALFMVTKRDTANETPKEGPRRLVSPLVCHQAIGMQLFKRLSFFDGLVGFGSYST